MRGKAVDVSDHQSLKNWIEGIGEDGGIDVVVSNVSALNLTGAVEAWVQTFNIDGRYFFILLHLILQL